MKFGIDEKDFQFLKKHLVQPLKQADALVQIWCFGSRARGDHLPFSDLDIMVSSSKDLSTEITSIQEALSDSHLPFKVDLVEWRDFAESYKQGFYQDRQLFE